MKNLALASLLAVAACLAPASARAFFGSESRDALRALVKARHTPALADALCGKALSVTFATISAKDGLSCPDDIFRDGGNHLIVSARDLAEAGFQIGQGEDGPHLTYQNRRISREEVGRILEDVQKEEARARQRQEVGRLTMPQGRFTIEDFFGSLPR